MSGESIAPRTLRVPAATKTLQQFWPRSRTLLAGDAFVLMRWWEQRSFERSSSVFILSVSVIMDAGEVDTTATNGAIRAKGVLRIECLVLHCNFTATAPTCTRTMFTVGSMSHTRPSNECVFLSMVTDPHLHRLLKTYRVHLIIQSRIFHAIREFDVLTQKIGI